MKNGAAKVGLIGEDLGDVRLPGLYALLRQDPEGKVDGQAEDLDEAHDPQAAGAPPGDEGRPLAPVNAQPQWFCHVLRGPYGFYGVIFNYLSRHAFYEGVKRAWFKALRRRSQTTRINRQRFNQLLAVYHRVIP